MNVSADFSFWVGIVGSFFGILGTVLAVYQFATSKASSKRKHELQFILASINSVALQKQSAFSNQYFAYINFTPNEKQDLNIISTLLMAKDSCAEIAQMSLALEGVIDTKNSAIIKMQENAIESAELFNKFTAIHIPGSQFNQPVPVPVPVPVPESESESTN